MLKLIFLASHESALHGKINYGNPKYLLCFTESPQGPTLGFDRVTYLGTIQNDVAQVGPITIIQGFNDDVTLALYGG